jgi:hypothetical protein
MGYLNNTASLCSTVDLKLLAGEYFDARPSTSLSLTGGALASDGTATISIKRIGNY